MRGLVSLELLLRSLQTNSKCAFLRAPVNLVDIAAMMPLLVSLLAWLAVGTDPGQCGLLEPMCALCVMCVVCHLQGCARWG